MAKKARIRACPPEEATRTAMAERLGCQGRLGRQKLTKENLEANVFFMPRSDFCRKNCFLPFFVIFFRIGNLFFS